MEAKLCCESKSRMASHAVRFARIRPNSWLASIDFQLGVAEVFSGKLVMEVRITQASVLDKEPPPTRAKRSDDPPQLAPPPTPPRRRLLFGAHDEVSPLASRSFLKSE